MIESMVSKLEQQAAEEATHDSFCKSETAKSIESRETKTSTVEKYSYQLADTTAVEFGLCFAHVGARTLSIPHTGKGFDDCSRRPL